MEFEQALHGAFDYLADGAAFGSGRFGQDVAEIVCYRANEIDRIFAIMLVILDIAAEERTEGVVDQVVDFGYVDVLAQEWCDRCQEAVCLWLAIYTAYDAEQVEVVFVEEARTNVGRELFFEHVAEE